MPQPTSRCTAHDFKSATLPNFCHLRGGQGCSFDPTTKLTYFFWDHETPTQPPKTEPYVRQIAQVPSHSTVHVLYECLGLSPEQRKWQEQLHNEFINDCSRQEARTRTAAAHFRLEALPPGRMGTNMQVAFDLLQVLRGIREDTQTPFNLRYIDIGENDPNFHLVRRAQDAAMKTQTLLGQPHNLWPNRSSTASIRQHIYSTLTTEIDELVRSTVARESHINSQINGHLSTAITPDPTLAFVGHGHDLLYHMRLTPQISTQVVRPGTLNPELRKLLRGQYLFKSTESEFGAVKGKKRATGKELSEADLQRLFLYKILLGSFQVLIQKAGGALTLPVQDRHSIYFLATQTVQHMPESEVGRLFDLAVTEVHRPNKTDPSKPLAPYFWHYHLLPAVQQQYFDRGEEYSPQALFSKIINQYGRLQT